MTKTTHPAEPFAGRRVLTRAAIVAAAREIVAVDGLEALSLRRVAARLGVTAPALYAHVDDKLDLLRGVAELEFERLAERFVALAGLDPVARVRAQAHAYVEHALADPALFQVMFLFRPDWAPQPAAPELPAASHAFAVAARAVEDAMAAGEFVRDDPLLVCLALWSAAHGVATVLLAGLNLGPDFQQRLVDTVIDRAVEGFRPPART